MNAQERADHYIKHGAPLQTRMVRLGPPVCAYCGAGFEGAYLHRRNADWHSGCWLQMSNDKDELEEMRGLIPGRPGQRIDTGGGVLPPLRAALQTNLQTEAKSDRWKALAYDYLRGAVDGGALPEYTLAEYVAEAEFYATEFEHD